MKAILGVLAALVAFVPPVVQAQAWPSKQVRIIVPFPPAGFNDILGRVLAQEMTKTLGQPVIVENRAGSGSLIGTELAAKSPPDGHTLFIAALPFSVIQSLYKTSLDVTRDFAPITLAGVSDNMLVSNPNFPVNSVQDLLKLAREKPGRVNYGSSGAGTSVHLCMELFKTMSKTFMTHIPYKGSAPVVADLIAGQVDVMFDNLPNVIGHVKGGRMKALAVSGPKRSPLAPDVPTVAEAGVPGFEVTVWFGFLAPAGTPRDIIQRLNAESTRIINSPEVSDRFMKLGVTPATGTPEQFGDFVKSEVGRWAKVVKDAGIKAE
jgi:tripartite-type tricarboxylate transporter receptor subunit TctC